MVARKAVLRLGRVITKTLEMLERVLSPAVGKKAVVRDKDLKYYRRDSHS